MLSSFSQSHSKELLPCFIRLMAVTGLVRGAIREHPRGVREYSEKAVGKVQSVRIRTLWDPEAEVWVAESPDVPGLITEAETLEGLLTKLRVLIPELWELNLGAPPPQALTLRLEAEVALA